MFTGIIQKVGRLTRLYRNQNGWSLRVACEPWTSPFEIGESIAVQGACFTVTSWDRDGFTADVLDETLRRTALRTLREGSALNLERALAVGERMGSHFVTGHVDESGVIRSLRPAGRDLELRVSCSRKVSDLTVEKGSVTIDGVSLTVTAVGDGFVEVALIPHTREATSLKERRVGDEVNLESDILGKYVARLTGYAVSSEITEELLKENGFV